MNINKEQLIDMLVQIAPNRYLQAVLIILLFAALAKIIDVLVHGVIEKWTQKTAFNLDDHVLEIVHKPLFVSIILFGLGLATERLAFKASVGFVTLAGLKTIGILVWVFAIVKLTKVLLNLVSHDQSRFKLIQDRTLPLFNNLLILLITALSLYLLFLVWNIDLTAWIASAGILGLAISFAAKRYLGQFVLRGLYHG